MRGATSPRLLLELVCAQVLLPAAATDERSVLARLERLEAGAATRSAEVPVAASRENQSYPERTVPSPQAHPSSQRGRPAGPAPAEPAPAEPAPAGAAPHAPPAPPAPAAQAPDGPALARVRQLRPTPSAPSGQSAAPAPRAPSASAATAESRAAPTADAVRQGWDGVLEAVKAKRRVAWILLSNARVVSLDEGVLTLRFPRQGDVKGFQSSGYEDLLRQVLEARFGMNVVVRAVSGTDPPPGERRRPGPEPVPSPPSRLPSAQPPSAEPPSAPSPQAEAPRVQPPRAQPPSARSSRQAAAEPPPSPAPAAGEMDAEAGTKRPFGITDLLPPPDEEFDPDDEDSTASASAELTGMALVQRELGAQIIGEYED